MNLAASKVLALALCLLAASASARAAVHESLEYEHYDVHARPGRALFVSLNDASPFRPGKRVFHSATAWNLDWQVQPRSNPDGRCCAADVRIQLRGAMTLPRLLGGDRSQRKRFDEYLSRLREHELGHFEIGREAARELEQRLLALAPARSCGALQSAARDKGARLIARYEAMGNAYDVRTAHGRSQGAWLEE